MNAGPRLYSIVYAALLVLLAATFLVAHVDLGPFNAVAAMAIAWMKTMLVLLFFMHLSHGDRLDAMIITGSFVMLIVVLLGLTLGDYFTRPWLAG